MHIADVLFLTVSYLYFFIFEYTSSTTKAYSLPHPYGIFHSYVMHTPQDQSDHDGYHILPEELPLHQNRNADTHRSHNPILLLLSVSARADVTS